MTSIVLLKPFMQHERGRIIAPGGMIAERLLSAGAALRISDEDIEAHAEKPFAGVPRMSEAQINRMMAAPITRSTRKEKR